MYFVYFVGPQVRKMWEDLVDNCKNFFAREKKLKSGSGTFDFPGSSKDKYTIDIYNKMRFITNYLYDLDQDGICSTINSSEKKTIWKRELPAKKNQNSPKIPKLDKFAENKRNEKVAVVDILSKILMKFDDMTSNKTECKNSNSKFIKPNEESTNEDDDNDNLNKAYYIKFFDKFFKSLNPKEQSKSFDLLFDEIQNYL